MLELHKTSDQIIDVRKLKKPKLKGAHAVSLFIGLAGRLDAKRGMVSMDGDIVKSPWISKRQAHYDKYSSDIYKVAGKIMKEALISREKLNDEIKLLRKELAQAEERLADPDYTPETVEEKRRIVTARHTVARIESELTQKVGSLKEVKMGIDEATHQLYQMLQSKNRIITSQMLTYLRGARQLAYGDELLLENVISRSLYEKLGEGFEYCIDIDKLLSFEEKECDNHEYTQQNLR